MFGVHDQQEERTWRHLDTMQFETLIHARTPRVACPEHGVRVIELPWAKKYSRFTLLFEAFAVEVLKASKTVKHAQGLLRLSWEQTMDIMKAAVERGLARREAEETAFVGMDEKSFLCGKDADDYACVMADLDNPRILDVSRGRGAQAREPHDDEAQRQEARQVEVHLDAAGACPHRVPSLPHSSNSNSTLQLINTPSTHSP